ncbi:MAG: protein of unknown function, contains SWIM-type Zinc finger domain [Nitrospira sp.]|nr:protein of unknown function, contains SWIM-type Zinc finger domain [Nitrospira sp.]
MKGRIACSADRLSLLEPAMISSVVEPNAFQLGKQYQAERRVQMVDASDTELTSSVMGNSGLYEQAIRLTQGYLEAKCSCTLSEQPICRHGVAALLEYQRWSKPRIVPKPRAVTPRFEEEKTGAGLAPSGDVKLSELTQFTAWMQQVVHAIQTDQPVPDQPTMGAGVVSTWTQIIRQLDERRRAGEVVQARLDLDVRDRDAMVARLTQDLDSSVKESKSLQLICKDLQREVEQQKSAVNKTSDLSRQIEQFDVEVKAIASLLTDKSRRLENLADTCRDVATMLKSLNNR